ncbi:MAG: hypothetical protein OEO83_05210, partial [Alphaproteobacteria bacterium]|nr:hypothetical protein [Alphaproteobacteria bacterium]
MLLQIHGSRPSDGWASLRDGDGGGQIFQCLLFLLKYARRFLEHNIGETGAHRHEPNFHDCGIG